jgi:hypothetical protein
MQPYGASKHSCVSNFGEHIHSCTFIMLEGKRCKYPRLHTCHQNILLFNQGSKVGPIIGPSGKQLWFLIAQSPFQIYSHSTFSCGSTLVVACDQCNLSWVRKSSSKEGSTIGSNFTNTQGNNMLIINMWKWNIDELRVCEKRWKFKIYMNKYNEYIVFMK